jgi:hypothetical protein
MIIQNKCKQMVFKNSQLQIRCITQNKWRKQTNKWILVTRRRWKIGNFIEQYLKSNWKENSGRIIEN